MPEPKSSIVIGFIFICSNDSSNLSAIVRCSIEYLSYSNAAFSNAVIMVSPGTYYENIQWNMSHDGIQLIGADKETTIIDFQNNFVVNEAKMSELQSR